MACVVAACFGSISRAEDEAPAPLHLEELAVVKLNGSEIRLVALSPDGKTLLTVSGETGKDAELRDANSGKLVGTLKGHHGGVEAVDWSRDGKSLVVGQDSGRVAIWDLPTSKQRRMFEVSYGIVWAVAFMHDGKTIITGVSDQAPGLWNAGSGKRIGTQRAFKGTVSAFGVGPKSGAVMHGTADGDLILLDPKTGKDRKAITKGDHRVRTIQFSPDEKLAAIGNINGLWLVDMASAELIPIDNESVSEYRAVAFSADGESLVSMQSGIVTRWDLESRKKISEARIDGQGFIYRYALSADGTRAAMPTSDTEVRVFAVPCSKD